MNKVRTFSVDVIKHPWMKMGMGALVFSILLMAVNILIALFCESTFISALLYALMFTGVVWLLVLLIIVGVWLINQL